MRELYWTGSPWTLACYMIREVADGFPRAVALAKNHPAAFNQLMEKLHYPLLITYGCRRKAEWMPCRFLIHGKACARLNTHGIGRQVINLIVESLKTEVPIILYGIILRRIDLLKNPMLGLSLGHDIDLAIVRQSLPAEYLLQGNLPLNYSKPLLIMFTKKQLLF